MKNRPPITVSSLDLERIERLLDSEDYEMLPGVEDLQRELDRAEIVDPDDVPAEIVTMNSTIRFRDESSGSTYELTLVYPGNSAAPDSVSILAPIGSALLGLSVGQSISWQIPGGRELELNVLKVTHQPEASGELHR